MTNGFGQKIIWLCCGVFLGGLISAAGFWYALNNDVNDDRSVSVLESPLSPEELPVIAEAPSVPSTAPDVEKPSHAPTSEEIEPVKVEPVAVEPAAVAPAPKLVVETEKINVEFQRLSQSARELFEQYRPETSAMSLPKDYRPILEELQKCAQTAKENGEILELEKEFRARDGALSKHRERLVEEQIESIRVKYSALKGVRIQFPDSVQRGFQTLCGSARELAELEIPEKKTARRELFDELEQARKIFEEELPLLNELERHDEIQTLAELRTFFKKILSEYPKSEVASDFREVERTFPALELLEEWNQFIEKEGKTLEHFSVAPTTARKTIDYLRKNELKSDFIPEWKLLMRRLGALESSAIEKSVQRPILDLLENAAQKEYFLYRPEPYRWFYFMAKPEIGVNLWQKDLFGGTGEMTLGGKEIAQIGRAKQTEIFKSLAAEAGAIDDSLCYTDPGLWYQKWCSLIEKLRNEQEIDPLMKFLFLKDICRTLSDGDLFFARRLAPWNRVLGTAVFELNVNWYDAEDSKTAQLRQNAEQLLLFLKTDELSAVKTTEELDRQITPVTFAYRIVGRLDRDLAGNWYFRRVHKNKNEGALYVFLSRRGEKMLLPIGTLREGQWEQTGVSDEFRRGMPVFCRVAL